MAFRKNFPSRRRSLRRRRHWETFTLLQCRTCVNVFADATCSSPIEDDFTLMSMATQRSLFDATEVSNLADRFVTIAGIKFESIYHHDPNETIGGTNPEPGSNAFDLAFNLTIYEAIVVVPVAQGTTNVPAYTPVLTSANFQAGDLADRVLWKRISFLPIWGININGGIFPFPQLTATIRDTNAGPQVVKARVKLDDRHMLLYCRNYVHNIFVNCLPRVPCDTTPPVFCGIIPVRNDAWFKIFYTTKK